jgi:hypothetical protein
MPIRNKHSCLLRTFVNYGRKKFYNIGPIQVLHVMLWIFVIVLQLVKMSQNFENWSPQKETTTKCLKVQQIQHACFVCSEKIMTLAPPKIT